MPFVPSGSFFVSDPELGSKLLKSERDFAQQQESNRQADRLFKANRRQAKINNRLERKKLFEQQQANADVNTRFFFGQNADTQRLLIQQGGFNKRGMLDRTSRENIAADANTSADARNQATIDAANQRAATQRAQDQQRIDNAKIGQQAVVLSNAVDKTPKGSELRSELLFKLVGLAAPQEDITALRALEGDPRRQVLEILNKMHDDQKKAVRKNSDNPQALSIAMSEILSTSTAKLESILGTDSKVLDVIAQSQADVNARTNAQAKTAGEQAALNSPQAIAGAGARAGVIANAQQQAKPPAAVEPVALNTAERRQAQSGALLDAGVIDASAQEDSAAIAASDQAETLANRFGLDKAAVRRITTTELAKDLDRIFTFVGPGDAQDSRFAASADTTGGIFGFFANTSPLPEQPIARQVTIKMQRQAKVFVETQGRAGLDPASPQWAQALSEAFRSGGIIDDKGNIKAGPSSIVAQIVAQNTGELLSIVDKSLGR